MYVSSWFFKWQLGLLWQSGGEPIGMKLVDPCGKVLELEEWVYLLDMLHAELDRNASIERFEETLCWDRSDCLEMPLPKKITCSTRV